MAAPAFNKGGGEGFTPENFENIILSSELEVMSRTYSNILMVIQTVTDRDRIFGRDRGG